MPLTVWGLDFSIGRLLIYVCCGDSRARGSGVVGPCRFLQGLAACQQEAHHIATAEDSLMIILDYIIRCAVPVVSLALLTSNPAAGQVPKLSQQQLNPTASIVNKPITAAKAY